MWTVIILMPSALGLSFDAELRAAKGKQHQPYALFHIVDLHGQVNSVALHPKAHLPRHPLYAGHYVGHPHVLPSVPF